MVARNDNHDGIRQELIELREAIARAEEARREVFAKAEAILAQLGYEWDGSEWRKTGAQ